MSTKSMIYNFMREGAELSALDAINYSGQPSAPRRLRELQEAGLVVSEWRTSPNGARYKVYKVAK